MRILTVSDIHVDYSDNLRWIRQLSTQDYQDDILILAGDITDVRHLFVEAVETVRRCFAEVLFVPGNHDLWVHRNGVPESLAQFAQIQQIAADTGLRTSPLHLDTVSIVPLLGWYDFSFGVPARALLDAWMDFIACEWPEDMDPAAITRHFVAMNEASLDVSNETVITFSHFLPRIEVMPDRIPLDKRVLYPVLGSTLIGEQVNQLQADIHIYGHSHVNRHTTMNDRLYINNAFGYPHETRARKGLFKVLEL